MWNSTLVGRTLSRAVAPVRSVVGRRSFAEKSVPPIQPTPSNVWKRVGQFYLKHLVDQASGKLSLISVPLVAGGTAIGAGSVGLIASGDSRNGCEAFVFGSIASAVGGAFGCILCTWWAIFVVPVPFGGLAYLGWKIRRRP